MASDAAGSRIQCLTTECGSIFKKCAEDPAWGEQLWIHSTQGNFNLWCNSVEMTRSDEHSLDSILRTRSEAQDAICNLLQGLIEALRKCQQLIKSHEGDEEQYQSAPSSSGSSNGSATWETMSRESGASEYSSENECHDPLLSENISYIKTILGQLMRISLTTRESDDKYRFKDVDAACDESAFHLFRKYLTTEILEGFEDVEADKLSTAEKTQRASDYNRLTSIQKRLISVNIYRKNRMLHIARKSRLAETEAELGIENVNISPNDCSDIRSAVTPNTTQQVSEGEILSRPSIFTNPVTDVNLKFNPKSGSADSVESEATGLKRMATMQEYSRFPIPQPDGSFRCPYCLKSLPSELYENEPKESWKLHIAQHVMPYSCLVDNCETPLVTYVTADGLISHMYQKHSCKRWTCDHCTYEAGVDDVSISYGPLQFATEADWISHYETSHQNLILGSHYSIFARLNERSMIPHLACPLCQLCQEHPDLMSIGIDDHILQHLHAFAVKALPADLDGIEKSATSFAHVPQASLNMANSSFSQALFESLTSSAPMSLTAGALLPAGLFGDDLALTKNETSNPKGGGELSGSSNVVWERDSWIRRPKREQDSSLEDHDSVPLQSSASSVSKTSRRAEKLPEKTVGTVAESEFAGLQRHLTEVILREFEDPDLINDEKVKRNLDHRRLNSIQKRLIQVNVLRRKRFEAIATAHRHRKDVSFNPKQSESQDTSVVSLASSININPNVDLIASTGDAFPTSPKDPTTVVLPRKVAPSIVASKFGLTPEAKSKARKRNLTGARRRTRTRTRTRRRTLSVVMNPIPERTIRNLPKAPKCDQDGSLECPYCFKTLPPEFARPAFRESWISHVLRDLVPYSCIMDNCKSPHTMFHTTASLNAHLIKEHSLMQWICNDCNNLIEPGASNPKLPVFVTAEEWKEHVSVVHEYNMLPGELDTVADKSRHSMMPCPPCPLCPTLQKLDDLATIIPSHILQHLQQFSLESLPERFQTKSINDFVVLEVIGQGAYAEVKLCRHRANGKKAVIKYVTKRRILQDTWTRDWRGTVPLEIHVLDHLSHLDTKHPNIMEMTDFFEDNINYYIETEPHGLPGMDLFDYIELRVTMEEKECRSIFVQIAHAVHFLHTEAGVVHRDIKDENVILDGDGKIQLIDFGSAAYVKNGPFDIFVGTIDYAAPEVLAGKAYGGKEQDVWALGILLYTLIYKENPFYSIDEIMEHDLRVPWTMSEGSIDLVRLLLDRDVETRITTSQILEHPWCCEIDEVDEV